MSPRNTTTGAVLEAMILPSLKNGGYTYDAQAMVGARIGGRQHIVDVLARKDGQTFLVSLKWQQVSGTAEQKIPFEVICLAEAVLQSGGTYTKAYLVLGGEGWSLRDFYTQGGLERHLEYAETVDILTLEAFVARAKPSPTKPRTSPPTIAISPPTCTGFPGPTSTSIATGRSPRGPAPARPGSPAAGR